MLALLSTLSVLVVIIASTQPWALAPPRSAEAPLTPFRATDYLNGLESYLSQIELVANTRPEGSGFDSSMLGHAIFDFGSWAREFDKYTAGLTERLGEHFPCYARLTKMRLLSKLRVAND